MASIIKETVIDAPADEVWAVLRDFGAVDRLAPGFITESRLDADGSRMVTFFNGAMAREILVSVDDEARRLVYSVVESPLQATHDNSSAQVFAEGEGRCRFLWIKDVLPDEIAGTIDQLMERGIADIKQTMEASRYSDWVPSG
jgi:carbon monoxide dehydrogenase subunit G